MAFIDGTLLLQDVNEPESYCQCQQREKSGVSEFFDEIRDSLVPLGTYSAAETEEIAHRKVGHGRSNSNKLASIY